LNGREIEVARLAAEGLSNQAIGERLFLSKDGVKSRLKSVFEKLNVTSRKQLGEVLKL
jgi:DNA-binding NarL/FixJ family response regulator